MSKMPSLPLKPSATTVLARARETLDRLQARTDAELNQPKRLVANLVSLSEATLWAHLKELSHAGVIPASGTLSERVRSSDTVSPTVSRHSNPLESEENSPESDTSDTPEPERSPVGNSSTNPPDKTLSDTGLSHELSDQTKKRKSYKEKKEKPLTQPTAAAVEQVTQVKLPSGLYTLKQIATMCMSDHVPAGDWSTLSTLHRKPTHAKLWRAVVVGTEVALRKQYCDLWAVAMDTPSKLAHDKCETPSSAKHWERATQAVIEVGLGVAEYLRRAQDNSAQRFKMLPIAFMASEATKQGVLTWMSTSERQRVRAQQSERAQFDGLTLEEVHERTRKAGV